MWRALTLAALFLTACGTASTTPPTQSSTQPLPTPTATAPATPTATPVPTPVACTPLSGGSASRARITDMRIGTSGGHDTLVIQFDTAVTRYELTSNPTGVQFAGGGGKGGSFTLAGTFGLRLNILNLDWTVAPGDQYPHGTDLKQSAPALLEARQIGDFEGTANIAIGLSQATCGAVSILSGPPRLVIQFATG